MRSIPLVLGACLLIIGCGDGGETPHDTAAKSFEPPATQRPDPIPGQAQTTPLAAYVGRCPDEPVDGVNFYDRTGVATALDGAVTDAALRRAIVRSEGGVLEVLPVTGDFDRARPLRIALLHPAKAAADVKLVLDPAETGWRARADIDPTHDWNVHLESQDGSWRLLGRLPKDQHAAHLRPALQGDG